METAIKLALERGWQPAVAINLEFGKWSVGDVKSLYRNRNSYLLEPLFWKCLGKALGWETYEDDGLDHSTSSTTFTKPTQPWLREWHRFIDWLADGKSPDDFFKELLAQK